MGRRSYRVGEERVLLDRPQVLRLLSRIAAERDTLAGRPALGTQGAAMDDMDARQWAMGAHARHRQSPRVARTARSGAQSR